MTDQPLLKRIILDPAVMASKPVIKGTCLTVEYILNLPAHSATTLEIVEEHEGLTPEDVRACVLHGKRLTL